MLKIVKIALYSFIIVFFLTTLLALSGLGYLWFSPEASSRADLPYLGSLVTTAILEVIAVVVMLVKKGFRYLPHVENHKTEAITLSFMKNFVTSGSTVQIVSSRLSWIRNSPELMDSVKKKAREGASVEVITPSPVEDDIRNELEQEGIRFFVTNEETAPEARFTLVNGNRSGAERLAIARGSHPEHEVTIFDNHSGPQIIGMAKDIIRKSKEKANAA
ncbi:hypothetical protein DSCO28_21380 [Desulfosarcina ovata subsp. sediminis]|uniref:Uncharacterized protein n=1 Tax=Desulfosarcina ovata subsp. sediminis TaxID=885957 RepID=A0A5K7ZHI7_9BACT|nr:hypothetical protein [Desulfosarcina ovata]BBO81572.1 hypothetical protein DSCO28_21380 [Desulfosarcina ovata subsp. sediminis]